MNGKQIFGALVAIAGLALILGANYIEEQVAEGKLKIARGQQQIDTTDSLFSVSQYTKPIGKQFTKSGQKKIDAGNAQVAYYEDLSNQLQMGGGVLIVAGAGIMFFCRRKRSS